MSREHPAEYRRYRQTLSGLTVGVTSFLVIWLLSSVASALFLSPRSKSNQPDDGERLRQLSQCQQDVEGLFEQVESSMLSLSQLAAGYEGEEDADPQGAATRWVEAQTRWLNQWQDTEHRCRFRALRDKGLGASFDHLAWGHARLGELHDAYVAQLYHFMARHASEVEEIRRALRSSRKAIEELRGFAGPPLPSPWPSKAKGTSPSSPSSPSSGDPR